MKKALEVFGEKGFYLAAIEKIDRKSNFFKTALGKYFKSKGTLFGGLIDLLDLGWNGLAFRLDPPGPALKERDN
ncbi:MAG: TetR family transcriptional regulator [Bacillota bacterium]